LLLLISKAIKQQTTTENLLKRGRFFFAMFAVLTRSVLRRPTAYSLRCASTPAHQPPSPGLPSDQSATSPSTSLLPSLDFSPPEPDHKTQRTGAKSSKDSLSTTERRRKVWGRASLALLALGLGLNTAYMGREWTEEELKSKKLVCYLGILCSVEYSRWCTEA
jgi:import inner membrane translocase subunit TIM50